MHNLLQRANIKLTSYLSDIFSKTGLTLLNLFINSETLDLESVTTWVHGQVKATSEQLLEVMQGKLSLEDRFLLDQSLEDWAHYQTLMTQLEAEIQNYISTIFQKNIAYHELFLT